MVSEENESQNYSSWSQDDLIKRVTQLENELKLKNLSIQPITPTPVKKVYKKPRSARIFDASKYNTRLIALKIAYLGKRYNGFEHHTGNVTPLTTIEEELWKALNKARLIFPADTHPLSPGEVNWDGCEYSKCGRTDKGVSAFGQVIGIRVRSNRPLAKTEERSKEHVSGNGVDGALEKVESSDGTVNNNAIEEGTNHVTTRPRRGSIELVSPPLRTSRNPIPASVQDRVPRLDPRTEAVDLDDPDLEEALNFDHINDEIPYPSLLNRLLPPDIQVLAWCPAPPSDFSARFSCRERQYRYFFTQPAFPPTPHHFELDSAGKNNASSVKSGWLDIEAMGEAAKLFEGEHDFRNFCKLDPSKQITNFSRNIFFADIEEVEDTTPALNFFNSPDFAIPGSKTEDSPKVYTFTLHGSAFLWHQVRCMISVLFLVAQGLEKPSIISELLDVEKNPRKPTYEMATDTPLVLWDCIFPRDDDPERKNALEWIHMGDEPERGDLKHGTSGLVDDLWKVWRERKIDEILARTLIDVVSKQGKPTSELIPGKASKSSRSQKVFDGGNTARLHGTYTPVMKKLLMDPVEAINESYAMRKGFKNSAEMKELGFRRENKPKEDAGGLSP